MYKLDLERGTRLRNEERDSGTRNETPERGTRLRNEKRDSGTRDETLGRGTRSPTTLFKWCNNPGERGPAICAHGGDE